MEAGDIVGGGGDREGAILVTVLLSELSDCSKVDCDGGRRTLWILKATDLDTSTA